MDITNIISINGISGLHKVVAQIKNGVLVESLIDGKRIPAYASHQVSKLEDISIYSTSEDVLLKEVFQKIFDKENGGECLSHKQADAELKKYFLEVFAEYDQERVHVSVIKKVLNWYNILKKAGLLDKKEEENSEEKKIEIPNADGSGSKGNYKDAGSQSLKTAGSKVGATGVRKTGVA